MAAVAAELHLGIDDLELDAADAVEKGAAALFLAGFGFQRVASIAGGRTAKGSGRKAGRSADVRRARRLHTRVIAALRPRSRIGPRLGDRA